MTIDERLEFLLQSTESLHESVQQNTIQIHEIGVQMRATDLQIKETHVQMRATDLQMKATDLQMKATDLQMRATNAKIAIIAETIRDLGAIARNHQDHIVDHGERLDKLEGPALES